MAVFFISLLSLSIVGLIALLAVKRWELSSGRILLGGIRPKAEEVLGGSLQFVEERAPVLVYGAVRKSARLLRTILHRFIAWGVLHVERGLERTLHTLRGAGQQKGEGEASAFLREVAEHKRSLLKRSGKKRNAIYEE